MPTSLQPSGYVLVPRLNIDIHMLTAFQDEWISQHLHAYLPGLSTVLSFASLSVRPGLYSLYEDHLVKLPAGALRPSLKSLLLALLPAIEEETSEDFDRAFGIVETIQSRFTDKDCERPGSHEYAGYFWQCLFLCVVTCPSRRLGALNYLARKLPRLSSSQSGGSLSVEAEVLMSPEPGLLIRCFVAGLGDPQLLVQRGFLDLLVTHMPLHSEVLQLKVRTEDLEKLVSSATDVLLRRDMGLNKRLWSWFLGPDPQNGDSATASQPSSPVLGRTPSSDATSKYSQFHYFSRYGKEPLERCILRMFDQETSTARQKARPFRICLSLMDRWEIGGVIVPRIFVPAMRSAYDYSLTATSSNTSEMIRSASAFFDGVEASLIWASLFDLVRTAIEQNDDGSIDTLRFFHWLVKNFNVRDEEMITTHVPYVLLSLLSMFVERQQAAFKGEVSRHVLATASLLVDMIPARCFVPSKKAAHMSKVEQPSAEYIQETISAFYSDESRHTDTTKVLFDGQLLAELMLRQSACLLVASLGMESNQGFPEAAQVLATLLPKIPRNSLPALVEVSEAMITTAHDASVNNKTLQFPTISWMIMTLAALSSVARLPKNVLEELEPDLTGQLWLYLSPMRPKHHVEVVRCMWTLADLMPWEDGIVVSLLNLASARPDSFPESKQSFPSAARHFITLWNHSIPTVKGPGSAVAPSLSRRGSTMATASDLQQILQRKEALSLPLLNLLDALEDPSHPDFDVTKSWLSTLTSLDQVLEIVMNNLTVAIAGQSGIAMNTHACQRTYEERIRVLESTFRMLRNILLNGNAWTVQCLRALSLGDDQDGLTFLVRACNETLLDQHAPPRRLDGVILSILDILVSESAAAEMRLLDIDAVLLNKLLGYLDEPDGSLQAPLLHLISKTIRTRPSTPDSDITLARLHKVSVNVKRPSITMLRPSPSVTTLATARNPPSQLLRCIRSGFAAPSARIYLAHWIDFLADILPMFADAIFCDLIPLVECLCAQTEAEFNALTSITGKSGGGAWLSSDVIISGLLEALEMVLARAHECLLAETATEGTPQAHNQRNTFLGNVASGMFRADGPPSKTAQTNSRLTVILAFQDVIRTAVSIWSWASHSTESEDVDSTSVATTAYYALRLRNKSRHLLEQMFGVEPLESLEVILALWLHRTTSNGADIMIDLLQGMQVSRPKSTVPTVLDALCSRVNPSALTSTRQSSQTTNLSALDIALFLSSYLISIEDDAIDEVWTDCTAFMRDVLTNPLPYRAILPELLSISRTLAEKIDNTNIGEQKRMRRELGDIFLRLLAAMFTTLPAGFTTEPATTSQSDKTPNLFHIMTDVVISLETIVETPDRVTATINTISSSLVGPLLRAKAFPRNMSLDSLSLVLEVAKKAPTAKSWRKEINDTFNNPKLLDSSVDLAESRWLPIFHQWSLYDRERISEMLSRLAPPSSAGIMFGVGANAARLEADRKTQLNLRRLCILVLASPQDAYATHLRLIEEKLVELFEASPSSSPSSAIKADLFMVLRALVLSTSAVHLAPLWPIINDNLQGALGSLLASAVNDNAYSNSGLLQACKLLDELAVLSPDDFQLHQWLYITDTIDAVYQREGTSSAALSETVAEALSFYGDPENQSTPAGTGTTGSVAGHAQLLLRSDSLIDKRDITALPKEDFARAVIRPFLSQLSIHSYESAYNMESPDPLSCRRNLLEDLFDSSTVVD